MLVYIIRRQLAYNALSHLFSWHNTAYCRFQLTFHWNVPNFIPNFGSSLRSSKVHNEIHKPVCKVSIWLVAFQRVANQKLCLQTCLSNFIVNFLNFATNFRSSKHFSEKWVEIDNNKRLYIALLYVTCGKGWDACAGSEEISRPRLPNFYCLRLYVLIQTSSYEDWTNDGDC